MEMPLDNDRFLRRECPTCEREFKWFVSAEDEAGPGPVGGYFCPYCRIQAPPGSWLTRAQVEVANNTVAREIVGPMLDDFSRDLGRIARRSGGMLRVDVQTKTPKRLDPLVERDDMRRIDFACHPSEPLKVLDDWDRDVFCLICSEPSRAD
jgi:hypothetical protein